MITTYHDANFARFKSRFDILKEGGLANEQVVQT